MMMMTMRAMPRNLLTDGQAGVSQSLHRDGEFMHKDRLGFFKSLCVLYQLYSSNDLCLGIDINLITLPSKRFTVYTYLLAS